MNTSLSLTNSSLLDSSISSSLAFFSSTTTTSSTISSSSSSLVSSSSSSTSSITSTVASVVFSPTQSSSFSSTTLPRQTSTILPSYIPTGSSSSSRNFCDISFMDTFGLPLVEAVVNKNKEKINLIIDRYVTHQRTTAYRQEEEFIQATLIEKGLLCIKRRLEAIASLDKPNKYTPLIRDEFTEYLMGTGSEISSDFLLDTETPTEKLLHLSSLRTPITKSTLREILGIFRILDTLKFKSLPTELVSETLPPTNGSEILHEDEYPLSISENERLKLKLYKNRILIWKNIQCGENGKAVQYHRQETEEFPLVATTEVLIFKNCNIGLRRLLSKFQKPHFYKLNNIRFIECFFLFDVTELQEYIPKYNYADMTFSFIHCADTKSGGCYIKNSPHKSFDTAMLLEEDKNKPSAIIQMQINRLNIKSFLGKIEFVPLPCFGLASSVGIKSNTVEATSSSSSPAERLERKS